MAGHVRYNVVQAWHGGRVTAAVGIGAMFGVNKAAERLRALAVPLAPLDRGPLRESATVIPGTPFLAEAALVFDTPYAAIQHEDESFNHNDGQAKYVEQPMNDHALELQAIIAKEVKVAVLRA